MKKNSITRAQAKYFDKELTSLEYLLSDIRTGGKKITIPTKEIKDALYAYANGITYEKEVSVPYSKDQYAFDAQIQGRVSLKETPTYKKAVAEVQSNKAAKERNDMVTTYQKLIDEFRLKLIFGTEANELLNELQNLTNAINALKE